MTANDIADLIEVLATAVQQNTIDIKSHSHLNRALWDEARIRGMYSKVDAILQERAAHEMVEAIDRL